MLYYIAKLRPRKYNTKSLEQSRTLCEVFRSFSADENFSYVALQHPGGGGVLSYIRYVRPQTVSFSAVLVINRVQF